MERQFWSLGWNVTFLIPLWCEIWPFYFLCGWNMTSLLPLWGEMWPLCFLCGVKCDLSASCVEWNMTSLLLMWGWNNLCFPCVVKYDFSASCMGWNVTSLLPVWDEMYLSTSCVWWNATSLPPVYEWILTPLFFGCKADLVSCWHTIPTVMDCISLKLKAKTNCFFLKSFLSVFYHTSI